MVCWHPMVLLPTLTGPKEVRKRQALVLKEAAIMSIICSMVGLTRIARSATGILEPGRVEPGAWRMEVGL